MIAAHQVQVGDLLQTANGMFRVLRLTNVRMQGLFNPQTEHGDILVDGVRVSTYTDAIPPTTAHSMITPVRLLYRLQQHFADST